MTTRPRRTGATRRQLLQGLAGAVALPSLLAVSGAAPADRRLVVVHVWGGWDPTFVFDPKDPADADGPYPEEGRNKADRSTVEVFGGLPILSNPERRPGVTRYFEAYGHETVVVNGLQVGSVGHPDAVRRILTGTPTDHRPDLTAIVGSTDDGGAPTGFADLSGAGIPAHLGAAGLRLGAHGQIASLLDDEERPPAEASDAIARYLAQQTDRARLAATTPADEAQLGDRLDSLDRAARLRAHGLALPEVGQSFVADLQRATALIDQRAARAILIDTHLPWDSHVAQQRQHGNFDELFIQLHSFREMLNAGGHDDVLVVVVSEMGRSPRRNIDGGTEHWPVTSAMLLGAGVHGGRVLGATDAGLRARGIDLDSGLPDDGKEPLRADQFCAGVLEACGVDPTAWLPQATPFRAPYS